jgi:cyclopropane-fatty-acyl-phospholipid synthase
MIPATQNQHASRGMLANAAARFLMRRFANKFSNAPVAFDVMLPDGSFQHLGNGPSTFRVTAKNHRALLALASIDEGHIGDAYLAGDLDLDGDMLRPFELRKSMKDIHLLTTVWRFLQPMLIGQLPTNKHVISAHYDMDSEFFLSFLDPRTPCYTQGIFAHPEETLDVATLRKFDYCYNRCNLKPGDHILEVAQAGAPGLNMLPTVVFAVPGSLFPSCQPIS